MRLLPTWILLLYPDCREGFTEWPQVDSPIQRNTQRYTSSYMYSSASSGIARPFSRSKSTLFLLWTMRNLSLKQRYRLWIVFRSAFWLLIILMALTLFWWDFRHLGLTWIPFGTLFLCQLLNNQSKKKTPNEAPKYFHSFAGTGEVPRSCARECSRISSEKMVTDLFDSLMCPSNRNESSKPSALGPVFSSGWIRANSSRSHSL